MRTHERTMNVQIPHDKWIEATKILNTNREWKIKEFLKEVIHRHFSSKNFFGDFIPQSDNIPEDIPQNIPLEDNKPEEPQKDEDWFLSENELREKYKYFPTDIEAKKEFADCTSRTIETRYSYWKEEWVGNEPKKDVDAVGDFLVKIQKRIIKEGLTYDKLTDNEEGFYAVIRKAHMTWCKHMIKMRQ